MIVADSANQVPVATDTSVIEDVYPLSSLQQGMLFHSLYNPEAGVDFEQIIITLSEEVDIPCMQRAWLKVIERHQVLRAGFCWDEIVPLQEIYSAVEPVWRLYDWSEHDKLDRLIRLENFLCEDRRNGFDMRRPPLLRFALMRMDVTEYRLVWSFHHAFLDGRAFVIVLKEVFAFYKALQEGVRLVLNSPRPYHDYITWLGKQDFSEAEAYWRLTLAGLDNNTSVKEVFSSGTDVESGAYAVQEIRLTASLTTAIRQLAASHEITPNTILQGAWAILLGRYTGKKDVVFGVTRACRKSAMGGADDVINLFINTLPLRVALPTALPVLPWLVGLRAQNIGVRPHEHTPLVSIQQWCQTDSKAQLFDSILVFENFLLDSVLREQGGDWQNRTFELRGKTNFPITVGVNLDTELLIKISYYQKWFSDRAIARMLGHLKMLVEAIVADPERQISSLPLLTAVEDRDILHVFNDTDADFLESPAVHHLFEQAADRTPDAIALVFEEQQLTYQQLNSRANQLAHYLQHRGAGPDVLVGLCVERSLEMIVGMLGILKAGSAYVPLDPTLPKERLAWMLGDAATHLIVTGQEWADFSESPARTICIDLRATEIALECDKNPEIRVTSDHLAYVIYTSGSTGR